MWCDADECDHGAHMKTKFKHTLPVAAIPKGSTVDASDIEDAPHPVLVIRDVHTSEPRAGLITWDTDHGRLVMSASRRVPVDLPTTARKEAADGTAPRPRRRRR